MCPLQAAGSKCGGWQHCSVFRAPSFRSTRPCSPALRLRPELRCITASFAKCLRLDVKRRSVLRAAIIGTPRVHWQRECCYLHDASAASCSSHVVPSSWGRHWAAVVAMATQLGGLQMLERGERGGGGALLSKKIHSCQPVNYSVDSNCGLKL